MSMIGQVAGLNVKPKTPGEPGLPKAPVPLLQLTATGAGGDFNRYRTNTLGGDPDSAVLLLTEDILVDLRAEGWPVEPGELGENVLLAGIPNAALEPGRQVRLGAALLEVTRACQPCTELHTLPYVGAAHGPEFVRTLHGRRGWYARVLHEGDVSLGDEARVLPLRPPTL
ncbi:MAG TPA: MOSC domain-containing protein [Gemmatimonadales bacterium]|jgi:MOSC domain-containing protein YiiM|nr:MOSC domain-containing protein [Gemmatimonadales bacterium]